MKVIFVKAINEYRFILAVAGACVGILYVVAMHSGAHPFEIIPVIISNARMTGYMLIAFLGFAVIWFFIRALFTSLRAGQGLPGVKTAFNAYTDAFFTAQRIISGLVGTILYMLIGLIISVGKSLILYVNDYAADPVLSQADKIMHGGVYPHEIIVPIVDQLNLFGFVNFAYLLWFPVMFLASAWVVFCEADNIRRMQFLWSSLILWVVVGVIGAMIFSSVGPIYFSYFYPYLNDPYAGFVDHLRKVNDVTELNVITMAGVLLGFAMDDRVIDLNGISAMPSMHVAIVTLIALYAFSYSRLAGCVAVFYVFMIMIGSVALGWHYAIDGYVSVILTCLLWWITGWLAKPAPRLFYS